MCIYIIIIPLITNVKSGQMGHDRQTCCCDDETSDQSQSRTRSHLEKDRTYFEIDLTCYYYCYYYLVVVDQRSVSAFHPCAAAYPACDSASSQMDHASCHSSLPTLFQIVDCYYNHYYYHHHHQAPTPLVLRCPDAD